MASNKVQEDPCNAVQWKITVPEEASAKNMVAGAGPRFVVFCRKRFVGTLRGLWKLGTQDPRRVYHAIKVGIALAIVSLFYFMHPLFVSVGGMATWAIMTVVVVFEFTAGATLSKGLNRMTATLMGGGLAVATNIVADLAGHKAEPYILGLGVFLVGTAATFVRFVPTVKARYDYGVLIFILTYSFVAVSGYRSENLVLVACQRLATIIIGCILCIIVSLVFCPIWAGEDLHHLIINNMQGLASSLEGCVALYFDEDSSEVSDNVTKGYKCVLNSKSTEESLANFARWEPAHGQFSFRYPWQQYVKIGAGMRYCAYCVEALNGCLNSEIQTPHFLREHLKAPCLTIAEESASILNELSQSIRTMTRFIDAQAMMARLATAAQNLHNSLAAQPQLLLGTGSKRWENKNNFKCINNNSNAGLGPDLEAAAAIGNNGSVSGRITAIASMAFMDTLPLATVACLLTEIVARLQTLLVEVDELGERGSFATVFPDKKVAIPEAVINIPNNSNSAADNNPTDNETNGNGNTNAAAKEIPQGTQNEPTTTTTNNSINTTAEQTQQPCQTMSISLQGQADPTNATK